MEKTTITFQLAKETKGTFMFRELDDQERPIENNFDPRCKIGAVYIRKKVFNGSKAPNRITITVDEVH